MLLSGNEAVALGALDAGVDCGVGYPGTPSTEILETFSALGGSAEWAPNEKVALEVGLGISFAGGRSLVTMKHVGLNVAADPLFTAAYTGVDGGLVIVSADDPGMWSSQNEQDNRYYAKAAGLPILEPSDSQEAYDFTKLAIELSEQWRLPVILRMTTRICHSKTVLIRTSKLPERRISYQKDPQRRVMVPAYARAAHKRLLEKLSRIKEWNDSSQINRIELQEKNLGIITSGVSYYHSKEAAPNASILKISMSYPFPERLVKEFIDKVDRCIVIEEGENFLAEQIKIAGITNIETKPEEFKLGELNVYRIRCIIEGKKEEQRHLKGKAPELCKGCPHRASFDVLSRLNCIITGDIGCYTLGVLPPYEAMDTCVCMGASIGIGLGLRKVLPEADARRVVSVIGDSTFVHSGITGLVEMVYNRCPTGHIVIILDNQTTAMTGLQEHPGTGRKLDHSPTHRLSFENLCKAIGVDRVYTFDPKLQQEEFEKTLKEAMQKNENTVIILRRPCVLVAGKIKEYAQEKTDERKDN